MKTESKEKIFLTVGSKKQKRITEKLLNSVPLPLKTKIEVVCDNDFNSRMGSGGALFKIIEQYHEKYEKFIVINSGGMSKRAVNYSVKGKIFASIYNNGKTETLLEIIIKNAEKLMKKITSGVLICCSDIIVETNETEVCFDDNVGFCIKADIKTATRHGVMFCDEKGKLINFLHKRNEEELSKANSGNIDNFLIDTGMVYFNDKLISTLYNVIKKEKLVDKLSENRIELNLYPEVVSLLSENTDIENYLATNTSNKNLVEIRKILFSAISQYSLRVCEIKKQHFIHFGTSSEAHDNILSLSGKGSLAAINSYFDDATKISERSVLENTLLKGCVVGKNCFISDIILSNIQIEDNTAVCGFKINDGSYITSVCDLDENPKIIKNGTELWNQKRFYKGISFTQSYEKFICGAKEATFSLAYCTENADEGCLLDHIKYLNDMSQYKVKSEYLDFREQIIFNYFSKRRKIEKVECLYDKTESNLPVRVNLSGTWTDAMPYCIENGGQVINMAVTVNGKKPIKVSVERLEQRVIEFCSDNTCIRFDFSEDEDMLSDFCLHRAVLETLGIDKNTDLKSGFRLSTNVSDIDKGSGLGTSSILLAGCFCALGKMFGNSYDENEILKMVFVAEQIMKTGGGWQDQVGGLLPSIKIGTTVPGIEQELSIEYISLPESFIEMFSKRLVIIPTGQRHFGRFIVNDVAKRYIEKNIDSVNGHRNIRELNSQLINSIKEENFSEFFYCINRHFELLKKISPLVSNSEIERLVKSCRNYTDAISILGAGGGGYLLAILKEDVSLCSLQNILSKEFPEVNSDIKKIDIYF